MQIEKSPFIVVYKLLQALVVSAIDKGIFALFNSNILESQNVCAHNLSE